MFAAFALSDEGNNFLRNKPDNKDPEKLKRILKDLELDRFEDIFIFLNWALKQLLSKIGI